MHTDEAVVRSDIDSPAKGRQKLLVVERTALVAVPIGLVVLSLAHVHDSDLHALSLWNLIEELERVKELPRHRYRVQAAAVFQRQVAEMGQEHAGLLQLTRAKVRLARSRNDRRNVGVEAIIMVSAKQRERE